MLHDLAARPDAKARGVADLTGKTGAFNTGRRRLQHCVADRWTPSHVQLKVLSYFRPEPTAAKLLNQSALQVEAVHVSICCQKPSRNLAHGIPLQLELEKDEKRKKGKRKKER